MNLDPYSAKVTAASEIEVDRETLDVSLAEFAVLNPAYYQKAFHRVHEATGFVPRTFNWAAALLGPAWSGFRGIWGIFWLS